MNRKQWRALFVSNRNAEDAKLMYEKADRITDLQVCKFFEEFEGGFMPVERLNCVYPAFLRAAFVRARENRLIVSANFERSNSQGEFDQSIYGFVLTDAGKHLVMTSVTGATARALINEIEEEMAGQA